ncbi:peptide chain release factor 1 [Candidatus Sumerlaeota bacterium]
MDEKLTEIAEACESLTARLGDPELLGDQNKYRRAAKRHAELERIVAKRDELLAARRSRKEALELAQDADEDMAAMARQEAAEAEQQIEELEQGIRLMLLPADPNDDKNIIIEIRAGTGGEEAALFVADLLRMYTRYAETQGWNVELLGSNQTGLGGFREVSFSIAGERVYSRMKYESGTHRVQRIPETEASGRIHTSAVTVAVLPEAEDVEVNIRQEDLRIDVYRSSGPGGQSVNTTDSAVRITHLPTDLVVSIQDEKSQHKNRQKAMKVLRARLYDLEQAKQDAKITASRKAMVGTGDRSQRIRTYNFPQNRLTDHRIGLSLYSLDRAMEGDIHQALEALMLHDQTERLKASGA